MELCEGAQVLARVGPEVILAGDVLPLVKQIIDENRGKVPDELLERERGPLIRKILEGQIQQKVLYVDAKRSLPEEGFTHLETLLDKEFEDKTLPAMMAKAKVATRAEMDAEFRAYGSSLKRMKQAYIERTIGEIQRSQNIDRDGEITHEEMEAYYQSHTDEFEIAGRVRWEELTVSLSRFDSEAEAHAELARMGDMVVLGRIPFAQVAVEHSHGLTSEEGGQSDWITQGSLTSKEFEQAVFTLPVGRMSPILRDERSFRIVRVIAREEAHMTSFIVAQAEIVPKIRKERFEDQKEAYMAKLSKKYRIWTIFDEEGQAESVSNRPGYVGPRR